VRYAIFGLATATEAWLRLSREQRRSFVESELGPMLARFPGKVRWFDAEAFSTRCSDVILFETDDLREYTFLMERLRDSKVFTEPYFRFQELIPAVEEGFREFEANEAAKSSGALTSPR
jgi:chlorite dismutase